MYCNSWHFDAPGTPVFDVRGQQGRIYEIMGGDRVCVSKSEALERGTKFRAGVGMGRGVPLDM